ncbi:MAG: rRNA maturation RNase YbeY [Candidatus Omnitrophica bacterium]|nr:rRNA maturation RNase YbeY [Candidatus Omnitrophota bacterium]
MRRLARRTLRRLKLSSAELSIALVDDAEIRRLNRIYRRLDRATDVLAFGQAGAEMLMRQRLPKDPPLLLGDVVVSVETARRRAGKPADALDREMARVLIHGILHLCGYDHHASGDRIRMHAQESALRKER